MCETGRRTVQSLIWGRAQVGLLSYQKSKCQDIRWIDIDRARMRAGSEAMGAPMNTHTRMLPRHIGAIGPLGFLRGASASPFWSKKRYQVNINLYIYICIYIYFL